MKKFLGISLFWIILIIVAVVYFKWFNKSAGEVVTQFISPSEKCEQVECPVCDDQLTPSLIETIPTTSGTNMESELFVKLNEIKLQLKNIYEKLDIQNSNTPDAVSVSLRTSKKTNIWIFPLDGSEHKQYVMSPSDDILRDTLHLLLDKSAFSLVSTKLDNDGNLTITLQRDPDVAFGGSAMVEQIKTSLEKTVTQFPQIKNVIIMPNDVLQP